MSSSPGTATGETIAVKSDHAYSTGGLLDHFNSNQCHHRSVINDGYRMRTKFDLTTERTGLYRGSQLQQASADLLNNLLKENQVNCHVYFSETGGFHNHRVHHLLAAYALGASPADLQLARDTMQNTKRTRFPINKERINDMSDGEGFQSMLGDDRHYHDYLAFFLQEFDKHGWKQVLTTYLFSGTAIAKDLFVRLFAGIWHNLILVGYGVGFEQPGIIAEGLAGACVHSNAFGPYLREYENLARASTERCKPLISLMQAIRHDTTLNDKDHWKGGNSFAYDDNVVSNAPPGMARLASQWKIGEADDLAYCTLELINVNAFLTGSAQRPDKEIKMDFVFTHHATASIFFSAFLQQEWMSSTVKARLIQWFARMNLLFYAASLAPELRVDEITSHITREPGSTWNSIFRHSLALPDDDHLVKFIRVLAHGEQVSCLWEKDEDPNYPSTLPTKGGMWLQIANMAIDSAESEPDIIKRWVRGASSDEAWAEVPDRANQNGE